MVPPEGMAHNGHQPARFLIQGIERAAPECRPANSPEVRTAHGLGPDNRRATMQLDRCRADRRCRKAFESPEAFRHQVVIHRGDRPQWRTEHTCATWSSDDDDCTWINDARRLPQSSVDHGPHSCRHTNAECQGEHRESTEDRGPPQATPSCSTVTTERAEVSHEFHSFCAQRGRPAM